MHLHGSCQSQYLAILEAKDRFVDSGEVRSILRDLRNHQESPCDKDKIIIFN